MNKYMITAWIEGTVFLKDIQFDGAEVVIGVFGGTNEENAKRIASNEFKIDIKELKAVQIA